MSVFQRDMQQTVEVGTLGRSVGYLATCLPKPTRIVISCSPGYGKIWRFALRRHPTAGMHVALSQHLLSFSQNHTHTALMLELHWFDLLWICCRLSICKIRARNRTYGALASVTFSLTEV